MAGVKDGDTVKVHYTGTLQDGTEFDSSKGREPLKFTMGKGQLIQGFENAVDGMEPGDSTTVDIPSDKAYGESRDDLKFEIAKDELPGNIEPEEGMQLQMKQQETGQVMPVRISEVGQEKVTIDANHPLAGKDLIFDIELVEIVA